jgi:hypothetical protein
MRYIAYGLAIFAAVLTIATNSYAQRVQMERKLEEQKIPQRQVQPYGSRELEKKEQTQKIIDNINRLRDAVPSSEEGLELHHGHHQHCQQGGLRDVECGGGGDLRVPEEGAESK